MTNRTFNENGNETNGTGTPRNELAKRLFDKGAIAPEDEWTFELIPEEILGLPAGTAIGAEELDLSDMQDVVLSMEYDITPGGLQSGKCAVDPGSLWHEMEPAPHHRSTE
jgi:hypothetical protein